MKEGDLGLTYEQAMHGIQTAVAYEIERDVAKGMSKSATSPKHLRVGVNAAMAEQGALAQLLMDKGIFTLEEYKESIRLGANYELARYQVMYPGFTFR